MKPYDLWRKLHYLRNEDYKTNDEQLANVCAAIAADRKAAQTEAADRIEALEAENERLKNILRDCDPESMSWLDARDAALGETE